MTKSYIKAKDKTNNPVTGFRTPDHMKGSIFSPGRSKFDPPPRVKFNPSQFRTQHKG